MAGVSHGKGLHGNPPLPEFDNDEPPHACAPLEFFKFG